MPWIFCWFCTVIFLPDMPLKTLNTTITIKNIGILRWSLVKEHNSIAIRMTHLIYISWLSNKVSSQKYDVILLDQKVNFCPTKAVKSKKRPTWSLSIDPRGRPQSWPVVITIFIQSVRSSVCPSQNFKIKRQSLPAGTVGWPSGSLMTPVLYSLLPSVLVQLFGWHRSHWIKF